MSEPPPREGNKNAVRLSALEANRRGVQYVIHFADGKSEEMPLKLKLGEHLWDWHFNPRQRRITQHSEVVWEETNAESRGLGNRVQLFMSTWANHRAGVAVTTLDYISALNDPAPFLLAITLEP